MFFSNLALWEVGGGDSGYAGDIYVSFPMFFPRLERLEVCEPVVPKA